MVTVHFMIGVFIALTAGIVLNIGNIVQKKAVNLMLRSNLIQKQKTSATRVNKNDIEITLKQLVTSKLWMVGFILQALFGAGLFIISQSLIGPTLTPVLGSVGLVVLVFASCVLQEKLSWDEYIGLLILIAAVVLLGFTHMTIDIATTDFLGERFMVRVIIYTGVTVALCVFCKVWSFRKDRFEGVALAVLSGLLVAIQNYWISPATALGIKFIQGYHKEKSHDPTLGHHQLAWIIVYLFASVIIVIITNLQTVYERQLAFRVGNAAVVIPVSHIPSHLSSVVIYSFVYLLPQPHSYSLAFMWIGIVLLLVSSFIFGKRGAIFEKQLEVLDLEEVMPLNASAPDDESEMRRPISPST